MRANATCGYTGIVTAAVVAVLAAGLAQAQINTSVQTATSGSPVRFPWRAGSLAVASFDGANANAALPGVYICGIAFLLPSGQQWVSTGAGPVALVAADLDADGDVDVAVAEQDGGSVSILTNDGLGGFTRTASYATGDPSGPLYPTGIAAADINGDGKLDLAVANRGAETVVVLRSVGGGFAISQTVAAGGEPNAVVVGDFDNDGWMDVAAACAADDTVKVFRNNHGLLAAAGTFEGGPFPEAIGAADLDNDGDLDLATADRDAPQVTVLLNDGAGQFIPKEVFLSESNARFEAPVDLQIADLDSDGWMDIRCAGVVLHNDGGGQFGVADANTMAGAAYGQGLRPNDPTLYLGVAYAPSSGGNTVHVAPATFQFVRIHVSESGDDANNGLTWATAKRTIQAGVSAAGTGRQVWVAQGTYMGSLTVTGVSLYGGFAGDETSLSQRDWAVHPTIVQGGVTATTGSSPVATRIDGFTIRNIGTGSAITTSGSPIIANNTITQSNDSAIFCSGGSPLIIGNTLTGNSSNSYGAITCGGYCSPTILNNTIAGNIGYTGSGIHYEGPGYPVIEGNTIADNVSTGSGGAIYCSSGSPTISGNTIAGNVGYTGGGIYCTNSTVTIMNNMIASNRATSGLGGGGILCEGPAATIANNVIVGNTARTGAGLRLSSGTATIAYNTIVYNSATNPGGGIWFSGTGTLVNTIIAFNSSGVYGSASSMQNNCVYGNTGGNYVNTPDLTGSYGNISADPKLAAALYGNFHIQPDSPCVDAGTNTYMVSPPDIDGQSRFAVAHVDIGADESDGTVWPNNAPAVIVRVSPTGNDANDGSSWALAKRTVQAGIEAAASGDVWVAAGTYVERVSLPGWVHVYGGFVGTETERSQRSWAVNETILDGSQGGSVVTVQPGCFGAIDGFTIGNGRAPLGGGIHCSGASPVIANNRIMRNTADGGTSMQKKGGGIYCENASPKIFNNAIIGNSAVSYGGGISCYGSSQPTIAGNTIVGNWAGSGGSIAFETESQPTIVNTIVAFNSSSMYYLTIPPIMRNNCVYGNNRTGTGGYPGNPLFVAASPGPDGFWGTADDTYDDLHLLAGSPCIDAGSNADVPADVSDIDGDGDTSEAVPVDLAGASRFGDDPSTVDTGSGTAPIVDMGAYERARPVADVNGDWLVDVVDLLSVVYSFGTSAGDTGFDPACDFNHDGTVDVTDLLEVVQGFGK